eukprot:885134-Prymnesium_polylepis.2
MLCGVDNTSLLTPDLSCTLALVINRARQLLISKVCDGHRVERALNGLAVDHTLAGRRDANELNY